MANKFILICVLIFSATASASHLQQQRFTKWIGALETPLVGPEHEKDAQNALLSSLSKNRSAAFYLQALGRIYGATDDEMAKIEKYSERLEDALGDVDKWRSVGNARRANEAKSALGRLLTEDRWYGKSESHRLNKMREIVSEYKWASPTEDRGLIAKQLRKQLEKVAETEYSFETLEKGNGLHRFRRQLRWFLMGSSSVDGVVQFKQDNRCPLAAYDNILNKPIANSPYAVLPSTKQPAVCRVSHCLFVAVVEAVEELGKLKDQAEKLLAGKGLDTLPASFQKKAEKIHADIQKNSLIAALIEEISACE